MGRPRRFADLGACYLTIVGLLYAIAGSFGTHPNGRLIAVIFWKILISPYPLITYSEATMNNYPPDLRFATVSDVPGSDHAITSVVVLLIGLAATVAGLALFQRRRWAEWIWGGLLLVSLAFTYGYFLANSAEPQFEIASSIRACFLEATWIGAFLLTRTRVKDHIA